MDRKKGKKKSSKKGKKEKKDRSKKYRRKDLAGTLKGLQKGWKKVEPRKVGAPVPDDSYQARIETAVIEESKASGRLQVNWGLTIADGDYEGRKVFKFSGLETDDNLAFLQGDIETLELAIPEDIGDLGETLEEAIGLLLEINVRTKDEFTNIDFIELLEDEGEEEESEDEEEEEEGEEEGEEEIPSEKKIKAMKKPALIKLIKEQDLDVETKGLSLSELRDAVIDELYEE